jgi:hypothetical protein
MPLKRRLRMKENIGVLQWGQVAEVVESRVPDLHHLWGA